MKGRQSDQKGLVITPATIYVKAVIPAKAGIQNWAGCRIKSGMTFDMFNCRSNKVLEPNFFDMGFLYWKFA